MQRTLGAFLRFSNDQRPTGLPPAGADPGPALRGVAAGAAVVS